MDENTSTIETIIEPTTTKPVAEAEQTTEQPTEKPEVDEAKVKAEAEFKENHDTRRMKRLLYEKHEALAELAALKAQQRPSEPVLNKPNREQFQDDSSYIDALTDWKLEQKLPQIVEKANAQRVQNTVQADFAQREIKTKQDYPDYDDVISENGNIPVPRETVEAILLSEHGPDIRYYLAKNPEQAQALNQMSPISAVREIGRIEERIIGEKEIKLKPKQTTKAPPPISPVKTGTGTVETDLDKLDMKEFIKRREESIKARNKR
jgi:hypothetical protein